MTRKQKLQDIISRVFEKHDKRVSVSPAWLATEAMHELDPDRRTQEDIYDAAHLQFRQLARELCRKNFEVGDERQSEMFTGLQARYPRERQQDVEPEYVLRERMTEEDVAYNVARLRSEGQAKLKHADELEAWWQAKQAA